MKDLSKMPFTRLLLPVVLGILLKKRIPCDWTIAFLPLSVLFFLLHIIYNQRKSYATRFLFGLFVFSFFIWLIGERIKKEEKELMPLSELPTEILAKIEDVPIERTKSIKLLARMMPDSSHSNVKWQIYLQKDSSSLLLQEGDWIVVKTDTARKIQQDNTDFNYEAYLKNRGVSGSFYVPSGKWYFVDHSTSFSLYRLSHSIQKHLVDIFRNKGIEGEELGVLSALSIGDKTMLSGDLKNSYSVTGASHILAVSGLHVGVVFLVFTKILSQIFRKDSWVKWRVVLSLLALWLFTFVTGLSPSVIRASIMLTFASVASLVNRKPMTFNIVFASAFFMLVYSPKYLFNVGFQLSYTAVMAILIFQKPLYESFVFHTKLQEKIWSLLSVSFAAQLGTIPLTLYYFHQTSNLFWLSGFIVIPLSAVVIYLSIFLWCVSAVPYLGDLVSFLLEKVVKCMNVSIVYIENFRGVVSPTIVFEMTDLVFFALLMVLLAFYVKKKSFFRIISFLFVMFVYSIYQVINKIFFVT